MPSTMTLQGAINHCLPFLFFKPMAFASISNEPAITSANMIQQAIVGPPFRWAWNRTTTTITTASGTQDYSKTLSNLGFVEKISAAITGQKTFELENRVVLAEASGILEKARPRFMSLQSDDNAGNLSFRFLPVPDDIYTVIVTYQKKAPLFTSLSQTWTIPDQYMYIYHYGFLAMMMMFSDDPRAAMMNQKFVAHLLGAQEGLDETQRNLFLDNWYAITGGSRWNQIKQDQATQARGM